jgi:light-regulated signal transduction histidine kinase (bacteriophytochrome)
LKDITDLKETQAALQSANRELTQYAKALKRSNRDLEHFAYVTSHDLQQPLRTVTGFLQLLERYYSDALDERARLYIDSAVTGADRMTKMIQALLDLSRVGTRGEAFKATDMETVLEETIHALQHNIEESEAKITHDALPTVIGDATQLGQLLQNLITNAIKFQRDGTQPHIHISATQEEDTWQFAIQDNGIGIDPEHSKRLFRVFQRLHTREEYPGVGIGLALCKRIVERHGGEIWVESEHGEGSTFYFTVERRV